MVRSIHVLEKGPFKAVWKGYLLSDSPGEYRISAQAAGKLSVKLRDTVIIDELTTTLKTVNAKPIDCHLIGIIPLRSRLKAEVIHHGSPFFGRPGFQQEPIGFRQFYHERFDAPDETWRRGSDLVNQLRCGACHSLSDSSIVTPGPSLAQLEGNLFPEWTEDWLAGHDAQAKATSGSCERCPHLG